MPEVMLDSMKRLLSTMNEVASKQVYGNTSQLRWTHSNDRGKSLAIGDRIFSLDGENRHRHSSSTPQRNVHCFELIRRQLVCFGAALRLLYEHLFSSCLGTRHCCLPCVATEPCTS